MNKETVEIVKAYRSVFKSEKGRMVLIDMAKGANIFTGAGTLDASELAFREGKRELLFGIFEMLKLDYEEIIKIFNEDNSYLGEEND